MLKTIANNVLDSRRIIAMSVAHLLSYGVPAPEQTFAELGHDLR